MEHLLPRTVWIDLSLPDDLVLFGETPAVEVFYRADIKLGGRGFIRDLFDFADDGRAVVYQGHSTGLRDFRHKETPTELKILFYCICDCMENILVFCFESEIMRKGKSNKTTMILFEVDIHIE